MKIRWTNETDFDIEKAEKDFTSLKKKLPTTNEEILFRLATEWNLDSDDSLPEEPINIAIEILKERLKDRK